MAKKSKYTEGVLARDKKSGGSWITFYSAGEDGRVPCREDIHVGSGGKWEQHGGDTCFSERVWDSEWPWPYRADLPRRGSAFECELEL